MNQTVGLKKMNKQPPDLSHVGRMNSHMSLVVM